jgi:hypothetical protein
MSPKKKEEENHTGQKRARMEEERSIGGLVSIRLFCKIFVCLFGCFCLRPFCTLCLT